MEVGSVNREETYRTDYTIYFDNPQESDAGQYTCYYGSAEIDYRVKVIGKLVSFQRRKSAFACEVVG